MHKFFFSPDTYVKTYLVDRGRQLYKRKTHVMSGKDPHYRQTLKYDASIIYGRTLLVSVWEKQRRRHTFDANTPIGSVEINVNQLQLHKLTIRWFKLRTIVNQSNDSTARNSLIDPPTIIGSSTSVSSAQIQQQDSMESNDDYMKQQQQQQQQRPSSSTSSSSSSKPMQPTITIDDE